MYAVLYEYFYSSGYPLPGINVEPCLVKPRNMQLAVDMQRTINISRLYGRNTAQVTSMGMIELVYVMHATVGFEGTVKPLWGAEISTKPMVTLV